jgi:hypothetical protein
MPLHWQAWRVIQNVGSIFRGRFYSSGEVASHLAMLKAEQRPELNPIAVRAGKGKTYSTSNRSR